MLCFEARPLLWGFMTIFITLQLASMPLCLRRYRRRQLEGKHREKEVAMRIGHLRETGWRQDDDDGSDDDDDDRGGANVGGRRGSAMPARGRGRRGSAYTGAQCRRGSVGFATAAAPGGRRGSTYAGAQRRGSTNVSLPQLPQRRGSAAVGIQAGPA